MWRKVSIPEHWVMIYGVDVSGSPAAVDALGIDKMLYLQLWRVSDVTCA